MVTTCTVLGSTFSRQRICRPRCARGDDRAGGDNALTGALRCPGGAGRSHLSVLPWLRVPGQGHGAVFGAGTARLPASASGCSAQAGSWEFSARKDSAGSLSRNDAAGSRHSSPSARCGPLRSHLGAGSSKPWWMDIHNPAFCPLLETHQSGLVYMSFTRNLLANEVQPPLVWTWKAPSWE